MMRICVTWDVLLVLLNPRKTLRLAGREHGRAIPLPDLCAAAKRPRGLADLGPALHALVCLRQHPKLAREVGAIDEVWLVVVRATVENVQAHAGAAKLRRQPDPIAIPRYHDVPELAREVRAINEVWLVVFRAAVENVQAHAGTAKQRR
jgi:hypothetical protein